MSKVFSLEPFSDPEPSLEATCINQPHEFVGVAGADFNATCTFKNTGKSAWPANVQLKLVNGTIVVYNALGLENQCVQPNEELNVTIEVKLPVTPGSYALKFRLVHGDNQEFGEEVTVNLVAKAATVEVAETPAPVEYKTTAAELEEPMTETIGNTFYVDRANEEEFNESVGDLDLSVNSWIVVHDDEEDAGTPSVVTEKEEKVETSSATVFPEVQLTEEEIQRNSYNKQVYMTRYEEKYRDNLLALMHAGFFDFEINLRLL